MAEPTSVVIELESKPCPLCNSTRSRAYLKNKDVLCGLPGEFQIVRCLDCSHLYMDPRPTPETILNCYPAH